MIQKNEIFKIINILLIFFSLIYPLILFLNRFLIPDYSFDTINYHLFLGHRFFSSENNQYEFFPTGLNSLPPFLEIPNYLLFKLLGYRLGSVGSLIYFYLAIFFSFKIIKNLFPKNELLKKWWFGLYFLNLSFSFNNFMQIGIYYVDLLQTLFILLSLYFLTRFSKTKRLVDFFISFLTFLISFLGKTTNIYLIPSYSIFVFYLVNKNKKFIVQQKKEFFLVFILLCVSLLPFVSFYTNKYFETGNPLFPLYNKFFKSDFANYENFKFPFGGEFLFEKIFWGANSLTNPKRLGEAQSVFHDYKINFYFIYFSLVIGIFITFKLKIKKTVIWLLISYLLSYLLWSLFFGYVRYGGILEILGGILLIIIIISFEKDIRIFPNILNFLVILITLVLNFRILNIAYKYEYSWRHGFLNENKNYFFELKNLKTNKITLVNFDSEIDVFLNCASPSLGYYVLSEFNKKPVFNINNSYSLLTTNSNYMNKQKERLLRKFKNKKILNYATIVAYEGLDPKLDECLENLKSRKAFTIKKIEKTNFLGYQKQKLAVIFGTFNLF